MHAHIVRLDLSNKCVKLTLFLLETLIFKALTNNNNNFFLHLQFCNFFLHGVDHFYSHIHYSVIYCPQKFRNEEKAFCCPGWRTVKPLRWRLCNGVPLWRPEGILSWAEMGEPKEVKKVKVTKWGNHFQWRNYFFSNFNQIIKWLVCTMLSVPSITL